jgi:monoamine oxidase
MGNLRDVRRLLKRAAAAERRHAGRTPPRPTTSPVRAPSAPLSRRTFLAATGLGAAFMAGCGLAEGPAWTPAVGPNPRVVILGAGLAGLVACDALAARGVAAPVFEARDRVGGRVQSAQGFGTHDGEARALELGAEFIDTEHTVMLGLCQRFRLPLLDMGQIPNARTLRQVYWLDGVRHDERALVAAFEPVARAILRAWDTIGPALGEAGHATTDPRIQALDATPLSRFLVDAGADAEVRVFVEAAWASEFGLDAEAQSALNLVLMLGPDELDGDDDPATWEIYGDSDERFKVRGGNDRVVSALAALHAGRIEVARPVERLRARPDGGFVLGFATGPDVEADIVVCTLPFTVLRDLTLDVPLTSLKRNAIAQLGYGTNAKLIVPTRAPSWEANQDDGVIFGRGELLSVWAPLHGQGGGPVALTQFRAGAHGVALGTADLTLETRRFITAAEAVWPGLQADPGRPPLVAAWPTDRWARGSYACYRPGQWTAIGGAEATREGRLVFAGEHTSTEFQGFMEGAARSGLRAADEVLALLAGRAAGVSPGVSPGLAPWRRRRGLA